MKWEVNWSAFAEEQVDEIFAYYHSKAGFAVAQKLVVGIIKAPNLLSENPLLGPLEPQSTALKKTYR